MAELLDPPKFERGTSPQRHPWFLQTAGPPMLPPTTIITGTPEEQPEEDQCPRCGNVKAAVCRCGYDWDNWRWVDRA